MVGLLNVLDMAVDACVRDRARAGVEWTDEMTRLWVFLFLGIHWAVDVTPGWPTQWVSGGFWCPEAPSNRSGHVL